MNLHPGTVVRYGDDPALYVRNNNGTWAKVHLGYQQHLPYTHSDWSEDATVTAHIEQGAATVVYASIPARTDDQGGRS